MLRVLRAPPSRLSPEQRRLLLASVSDFKDGNKFAAVALDGTLRVPFMCDGRSCPLADQYKTPQGPGDIAFHTAVVNAHTFDVMHLEDTEEVEDPTP